ncbi:MAG: anthrone oxygenase family protein [Betaproteobacteria bacterium]
MNTALRVAAFCAALGAGLMAGLFFAFSVSVMRALGSRPPAEGMAAMQAINRAIQNPVFLFVFFGTALACAAAMAAGSVWLFAGGALYLIGGFLVTIAFNVPRNNALARAPATDPESARLWAGYLAAWTAWNHVRTVASLGALALLIIGLS